jgi:DNA-binding NarL/FixJ family response regulator
MSINPKGMYSGDGVLNIAIIEDNEMDSMLLEKRLKEKVNYHTRVYTSTYPLFKYLDDKNDIDVVILDNELKERDSYQTLQKIKRKSPNAEVIVLANEEDNKYKDKLIGAGAYGMVFKGRTAVDKIIAHIENIKSNWRLKRENVALQLKARKRQTSVFVLIIVLLAILVIAAYMIFFNS